MSGNPGLRTRSWAFYPEPEFKLKIRSRSSVLNLGPETELWPFEM